MNADVQPIAVHVVLTGEQAQAVRERHTKLGIAYAAMVREGLRLYFEGKI